jgi:Tol biopolymer transport system component
MRARFGTAVAVAALAPVLSASGAQAAFPGSNGAIAFTRLAVPADTTQVFLLPPGGAAFAPNPGQGDDPAWSPDGRRILFALTTGMTQNLWVMNADGSGATQITHLDGTALDPTWSPDGRQVAFVHGADSTDGIVIANADGSGTPTLLPGTAPDDDTPAWSPDGKRIAFRHFDSGDSQNQIWVSDVTGADRGALDIPLSGLQDGDPAWSPDGASVYFDQGTPALLGCLTHSQIWVVPSGGGLAHDISPDPSISDYEPAPSPDGSQVGFARCDDPTNNLHHLYVMPAVGGAASPLTSGGDVDDGDADWQPTVPRFASAPSISGRGVNNQTLTASAGSSPGGGSTALQFVRCDAQGANCVAIPGASASRAHAAASSATYKLGSADLGHTIRVHQTQTNSLGSAAADSPATGSVVPSKGHCSNRFAGTARADRIKGSAGSDRISGGRGKDRLSGLGGSDCISGGGGNDVLSGGKGNDTLSGGAGNDRITAGPGRNKVSGGAGNDRISVRNHKRDVVNCGKGKKDRVIADKRDKLRGCELVKRR